MGAVLRQCRLCVGALWGRVGWLGAQAAPGIRSSQGSLGNLPPNTASTTLSLHTSPHCQSHTSPHYYCSILPSWEPHCLTPTLCSTPPGCNAEESRLLAAKNAFPHHAHCTQAVILFLKCPSKLSMTCCCIVITCSTSKPAHCRLGTSVPPKSGVASPLRSATTNCGEVRRPPKMLEKTN